MVVLIAKNIFFEYHNDVKKLQTLHELLALVKRQGFHYYIKESSTRKSHPARPHRRPEVEPAEVHNVRMCHLTRMGMAQVYQ